MVLINLIQPGAKGRMRTSWDGPNFLLLSYLESYSFPDITQKFSIFLPLRIIFLFCCIYFFNVNLTFQCNHRLSCSAVLGVTTHRLYTYRDNFRGYGFQSEALLYLQVQTPGSFPFLYNSYINVN